MVTYRNTPVMIKAKSISLSKGDTLRIRTTGGPINGDGTFFHNHYKDSRGNDGTYQWEGGGDGELDYSETYDGVPYRISQKASTDDTGGGRFGLQVHVNGIVKLNFSFSSDFNSSASGKFYLDFTGIPTTPPTYLETLDKLDQWSTAQYVPRRKKL